MSVKRSVPDQMSLAAHDQTWIAGVLDLPRRKQEKEGRTEERYNNG